MEAKKAEQIDPTQKTGLFLSIGFTLSIFLVITAFEWKQYEENIVDLKGYNANLVEELIDVPITELPPPPPPTVRQVNLTEVDNDKLPDENIPTLDIDNTSQTKNELLVPLLADPEPEIEVTYLFVEESASPKGGMQAFYTFVATQMKGKYPPQARRMGIEGRVFVEFIIGKDGSLSEVRAIKGIGGGCDEIAVKVIQSAPPWNPGKQRGKPVKQRYTLPIIFKLG